MGHPSDQQITQPKTSTSRVPIWKKKVKKVFQLKESITGWKEIEYLLEKGAIEALIKMLGVVTCKRRIYKLLNETERCIRLMKKWLAHSSNNKQLTDNQHSRIPTS